MEVSPVFTRYLELLYGLRSSTRSFHKIYKFSDLGLQGRWVEKTVIDFAIFRICGVLGACRKLQPLCNQKTSQAPLGAPYAEVVDRKRLPAYLFAERGRRAERSCVR